MADVLHLPIITAVGVLHQPHSGVVGVIAGSLSEDPTRAILKKAVGFTDIVAPK